MTNELELRASPCGTCVITAAEYRRLIEELAEARAKAKEQEEIGKTAAEVLATASCAVASANRDLAEKTRKLKLVERWFDYSNYHRDCFAEWVSKHGSDKSPLDVAAEEPEAADEAAKSEQSEEKEA